MKLYDIVTVQHPDYRHFGEILSLRTPADTFMVRMVPGHPGTLKEVPADRLAPVPKPFPRWVHYARVDGRGSFPIDMLRYDFAAPLNFDPETKAIDLSFGADYLIVAKASRVRFPHWTPGRWSSFLWGLRELNTVPVEESPRETR